MSCSYPSSFLLSLMGSITFFTASKLFFASSNLPLAIFVIACQCRSSASPYIFTSAVFPRSMFIWAFSGFIISVTVFNVAASPVCTAICATAVRQLFFWLVSIPGFAATWSIMYLEAVLGSSPYRYVKAVFNKAPVLSTSLLPASA